MFCVSVQSIKRSVRLNDGTMGFAEVITIKVKDSIVNCFFI